MTIDVGLRIDVDTFRGTRYGVPRLVDLLSRHDAEGTFYFSVGPDNMGRHLWRLIKPRFLLKMLRSNAPSLYGWDILLQGTCWPGRKIGKNLSHVIQDVASAQQEIGIHAWDHFSWQTFIDRWTSERIYRELKQSVDCLSDIIGQAPTSSASAGWRCNELALMEKDKFPFQYNSDCRGRYLFQPEVSGRLLAPQVPVTLPTYDELVGHDNIDDNVFNECLLNQIQPDGLNVYTIHAEVEGIVKDQLFEQLLKDAKSCGIRFVNLQSIVQATDSLPRDRIVKGQLPGREGWLSYQQSTL